MCERCVCVCARSRLRALRAFQSGEKELGIRDSAERARARACTRRVKIALRVLRSGPSALL